MQSLGFPSSRRSEREFENRMLRVIFRPMRDEITDDWRKLHNEEPHNLYYPPNFVRMIRSRREWVDYVACMGNIVCANQTWSEDVKGRITRET
jgi:hypothetical protein